MKKSVKVLICLIIALILEVCVFNFRSLQSMNYKEEILGGWDVCGEMTSMEDGILKFSETHIDRQEQKEKDNAYDDTPLYTKITSGMDSYLYKADINTKVYNLYVNISVADHDAAYYECGSENGVFVGINCTDEGCKYYPSYGRTYIIDSNIESSKYIHINSSGNLKDLKIYLAKPTFTGNLKINRISINRPVPFRLSLVRTLLITGLLVFIYTMRPKSCLWQATVKKKFVLGLSVLQCFIAVMLILANAQVLSVMHLVSPSHDQYYRLAEALAQGRVYIYEEPGVAVLNAVNPYDPTGRGKINTELSVLEDEDYRYDDYEVTDKAFYNGKYYVYFGIVPCLLFHLPWYLLFGTAFPNYFAVMVALIFIIVFWNKLLLLLTERYNLHSSVAGFILLSSSLLCVLGLHYAIHYAGFYFVPITCGLAFLLMGLYYWFKSVVEDGLNNKYLLIGSLFIALTAGCRPQFLMGLFFAVPIFYKSIRDKKINMGNIVCFFLPLVFIALMLMYYNYIRFESPFDFGANYNITSNDMTKRGFKLDRLGLGLFTYLLQPPRILALFPFIYPNEVLTQFVGVSIFEDNFGGILITNAVCWSLFGVLKIKEDLAKSNARQLMLLCVVGGVFVPLADAQMSGLLYRYVLDYGWMWGILVFIVCGLRLKTDTDNCFKVFILVSGLLTLFISFMIYMNMTAFSFYSLNTEWFVRVREFFVFWD